MVEEEDEFAHEGDEGDFLGFTVGHETVVNRFEDRVLTGGHERGNGEHSPHLLAATVNGSAPSGGLSYSRATAAARSLSLAPSKPNAMCSPPSMRPGARLPVPPSPATTT